MALTDMGYSRSNYSDILEDLIDKAQELFGEDIETTELTPLGKFIRIIAYKFALYEEEKEADYYAGFPTTATGVSLDRHLPFVGITRNPATPAQYQVTVMGTAGFVIPYGFEVSTDNGIIYYNTEDTTIGEDGTCVITVECVENGVIGNVDGSEINQIVNPEADVEAISGAIIVTAGTEEESDYELRQRFALASAGAGSCNKYAIEAALVRVPTVTSASVVENETDETDSNGTPPHSFTCFIAGGAGYEQLIAETIFEKKPIGIKSYGTDSYTITDENGTEHTINFSRTTNVNVYVKIELNVTSAFEGEEGINHIKNNIADYINSLGVGNDVILSAMYGNIYAVTGVQEVTSLQLSTDGTTYNTNNIQVSDVQSAICAEIEVTHNENVSRRVD